MYVSGHPLRGLGPYLKRRGTPIGSITKKKMGKDIKVVGLISGYRKLMTKAGKYMATFTVEDTSARVSGIMFPRDFNNYGDMLAEDKVVALTGKLDDKRGECQIMCNSAKMLSIETIISNAKESGTFDPDEKMGFAVPLLDDLLSEQDIEDPISLVINGDLYRINVPDGTAPKLLQSLNELLVKHKGDFAVEIFLNDADKTIKLPFGVNFSEELKKKVDSLLIS